MLVADCFVSKVLGVSRLVLRTVVPAGTRALTICNITPAQRDGPMPLWS